MKSVFYLDSNSRRLGLGSRYSRITRENPLTHPEAFQPHFHEFHIYTGPDSDDLDEDSDRDQSVTEKDTGNFNYATDSDSDLSVDPSDPDECSNSFPGKDRLAPTIVNATEALEDLKNTLNPPRNTGRGYKKPRPDIDPYVQKQLEAMKIMLNFYSHPKSHTYGAWSASSIHAAIALGQGGSCGRRLCQLNRQFIRDRTMLPVNPYGNWNESLLVEEDLTNEISLYLMEIGKEISATKLMEFINNENIRLKYGIEKPISERTARRYLNRLGYRWSAPKKGQYADGHEREDVVYYREHIFLPHWRKIESRMAFWTKDNLEEGPQMPGLEVVTWFHDETIFYAHDRRKKAWYHKDAPAKPYAKGEGASLMIADFVSAKFGWLHSLDGKQSARRVMKPGKNKDGYFSSEDICSQADEAMEIAQKYYPQYEHIFIYDNATTHLKRAADALSARQMPKNIPKPGANWGVETIKRDPVTGKIEYKIDGSPMKVKVPMADAKFSDGTSQPLYFPEGHERAGVFKGMAVILKERGFGDMSKVRAECKNFKCIPGATNCCCRRILFNQPDFANVPSLLEITCNARGFKVIFLPKFHCELNFIEQCWGYAKRLYRLNPESSREDVLQRNALEALQTIPLVTMRRFANRSYRFMDAYSKGLNGRQAAWAAKRYRGHRVLPMSIMDELEKAQVT